MTKDGKKKSGKAKGKSKASAASERGDAWVAPFPRPANKDQRYDGDHPWLAIVNAYGPQGLWLHRKPAPSWQPWCGELFDPATKSKKCLWWQRQEPACQLFIFALWRLAGILSTTAIIWGESESLRRQMRMSDGRIMADRAKFNAYLEAYAAAGFICYLADAEKDAAESLIFAKRKGQDRTGQESKEQNTATGSGVLVSENNNPSCDKTTGEDARAEQSTGSGTAKRTAKAQDNQPVNSQKPEAEGSPSGTAPEGPRIDEALRSAHCSDKGQIATAAGSRRRGAGQAGEPSMLGDSTFHFLRYNDPLALAFACEMHNETHRGACLYPGTREQRQQWPTEVWSDVCAWVNLYWDSIKERPDWQELCQKFIGYAKKQRKHHKSARNLAAVVRTIINKSLGIGGHRTRAGP